MTVIEREDAVFIMSAEELEPLSTSELKYVCKHSLLKIDYVHHRLNRASMRAKIISKRVSITKEAKEEYFKRCIEKYKLRIEKFQKEQKDLIELKGYLWATKFAPFVEAKKNEMHDTRILKYYENALASLN